MKKGVDRIFFGRICPKNAINENKNKILTLENKIWQKIDKELEYIVS